MTSTSPLPQSSGQTVAVGLGDRAYEIRIAEGLLDRLGEETKDLFVSGAAAAVVTNDQLDREYQFGRRATASLKEAGVEAWLHTVPEGESHKSMADLQGILDFLVEHRLPRQTVLFAVGGGVVGDMAGFAAAIYLRGIDYVQVPTSLLAMTDASVGGKTAVNHPKGKNLIGAFHQPRRVLMDLLTLASLPRKHYLAGLSEIIKHGVIRDAELFAELERSMGSLLSREAGILARVVRRNCEIKAEVVAEDERETGLRAILNFGHTLGHAVENLAGPAGMVHGEAVSIGMVGASHIAVKLGMWTQEEHVRLCALLEETGLPVRIPALRTEDILDRMLHDKKIVGKRLRFILPEEMGRVTIRDDVPGALLEETIEELKR